jgi:hypothetical protein
VNKTYIIILSISVILSVNSPALEDPEPKGNQSSLDLLASEIEGAIIFSRYHQIYKVVIGDWEPMELGEGEYARWGPKGEKIAIYTHRKIYVMDADGGNRRLITDQAWSKHGCPIEFHTNGREVIFFRRGKRGIWAVDIESGKMRNMIDMREYAGEPGISMDGKRMVSRVHGESYAIDLIKKTDFRYVNKPFACSSGISPDGEWLMNNRMGHKGMDIRSWDGDKLIVLRSKICQPDGEWDNHHWSNHNDYICAQGGKRGESYIIKVSDRRGTRVTWTGKTVYPDLYVARAKSNSKSNTGSSQVVLINENYNRLSSQLLIRGILKPTRANLDYAAYDSNVIHFDPANYEPEPPILQELSELHFDETLKPESLRDRLDETPLEDEEKLTPMSWTPLTEYLMDWDFDPGYKLAEAGWVISEHTWSDTRIPIPYQEISRVYLHLDDNNRYKLWVRIEFKPWVRFLKDIDDEDKDGFPEIYGIIDDDFVDDRIFDRLLSDYMKRVLSDEEIIEWGEKLGTDWYDKYYTRTLEFEQAGRWFNEQTENKLKTELGDIVLEKTDVVILGKPFGKEIYNVFLTHFRSDKSSAH